MITFSMNHIGMRYSKYYLITHKWKVNYKLCSSSPGHSEGTALIATQSRLPTHRLCTCPPLLSPSPVTSNR